MGKAKFIQTLAEFSGAASLYRLDPPLAIMDYNGNKKDEAEFVAVSAVNVPFSGPETYIFKADELGQVVNWGELDGSFRGELDHAEALRVAGYEIEQ